MNTRYLILMGVGIAFIVSFSVLSVALNNNYHQYYHPSSSYAATTTTTPAATTQSSTTTTTAANNDNNSSTEKVKTSVPAGGSKGVYTVFDNNSTSNVNNTAGTIAGIPLSDKENLTSFELFAKYPLLDNTTKTAEGPYNTSQTATSTLTQSSSLQKNSSSMSRITNATATATPISNKTMSSSSSNSNNKAFNNNNTLSTASLTNKSSSANANNSIQIGQLNAAITEMRSAAKELKSAANTTLTAATTSTNDTVSTLNSIKTATNELRSAAATINSTSRSLMTAATALQTAANDLKMTSSNSSSLIQSLNSTIVAAIQRQEQRLLSSQLTSTAMANASAISNTTSSSGIVTKNNATYNNTTVKMAHPTTTSSSSDLTFSWTDRLSGSLKKGDYLLLADFSPYLTIASNGSSHIVLKVPCDKNNGNCNAKRSDISVITSNNLLNFTQLDLGMSINKGNITTGSNGEAPHSGISNSKHTMTIRLSDKSKGYCLYETNLPAGISSVALINTSGHTLDFKNGAYSVGIMVHATLAKGGGSVMSNR